jgi:hypothetical protein
VVRVGGIAEASGLPLHSQQVGFEEPNHPSDSIAVIGSVSVKIEAMIPPG